MKASTTDLLVIGGGVVGLTIALAAKRGSPGDRVTVLEKEPACGLHASTRNSGVLHAGFYYAPDSLKARFTVEGNRRLTEYCLAHGIAVNRCGKLVVAQNADELPALDEMARRAVQNRCAVELIDEEAVKAIEPRVATVGKALLSPTTSSVDAAAVVGRLIEEARERGVSLEAGNPFVGRKGSTILTRRGTWSAGHVINAAGLYADRVAQQFGFGSQYAIIPFKGLYLLARPGTEPLRCHVYPVPDMTNQFHLGLHFTVSAAGRTKIGPTAIPALWREQYSAFGNFKGTEALEIMRQQMSLWWRNAFGFRRLALQEMKKYSRRRLVRLAAGLVPDVDPDNFRCWGRPGIRAQLYNVAEQRLVTDFMVEGDERSTHILNAVSPAFTCCLPFADFVIDHVQSVRAA